MATEPRDTTYNGWTNYETWCVNLWLDNEESTQDILQEMTKDVVATVTAQSRFGTFASATMNDTAAQTAALAERIKEYVGEENPLDNASMWDDLLSAALSEVNWREIASALIENS